MTTPKIWGLYRLVVFRLGSIRIVHTHQDQTTVPSSLHANIDVEEIHKVRLCVELDMIVCLTMQQIRSSGYQLSRTEVKASYVPFGKQWVPTQCTAFSWTPAELGLLEVHRDLPAFSLGHFTN
jgi:hypothetical protein